MKNVKLRVGHPKMAVAQFGKRTFLFLSCLLFWSMGLQSQTYTMDTPYLTSINVQEMQQWLKNAPMEMTVQAKSKAIVVDLPLPGGKTVAVRAVRSLVGPQSLYDRLPGFMTYAFQGIENPAISGRMTISPKGLDAVVFTPGGDVGIEAVSYGSPVHKVFYVGPDSFPHNTNDALYYEGYEHKHSENGQSHKHSTSKLEKMMMGYNIGAQRREFRMHVIADTEYSVAVCGANPTRPCVEMAIMTALNGMNAFYVRDMSVKLNTVNNNTIYLTGNPAGFAAGGGANNPSWSTESLTHHEFMKTNTTGHNGGAGNDNAMVPTSSYDVGHLFSGRVGMGSGGGGVAFVGVTCQDFLLNGLGPAKAGGGSGVPNPQGNGWVNLLAHEFTHQFNADHTWTGNSGFCTAGQFSGPPAGKTAYEPGSGSTIVSYSGICSDDNIPNPGNIDYYHTISIKEVDDYIESANATCETNVASGNSVPVPSVSTPGCTPNYNLPIRTPFIITGSATDANDPANQLTYTWEQFNKADDRFDPIDGPTMTTMSGEINPIIRSFFPSASPARTIPQMSTILSGNYNGDAQNAATLTQANWQGELLPEVAGKLTMRLTVRDNNMSSGGVEHADAVITVTNSGGPFAVTSPNGGENRTAGTAFNVTWNKVGTEAAPFNCANVDIHLSTDGGMTYPTSLGSHPNTGTASVTIPANTAASTTARIRVSCGNDCFRFFDISNANFNIAAAPQCTPPTVNAPTVTQPTCATPTGTIVVNATGTGTLEYSVNNGTNWQASSTFANLAAGNYNIKVRLQADPACMATYAQNPVVLNAPTGCCTPPTVNAPTVTQPTCATPTGTIVVNATGNGTLEYSVDNGATWQASSTFANLAAGNYNIKVRLQAD
ncbi:MAG TPA: hypothetical protein ENJ95_16765, partial [Bacteroidetes bacterium]|nr:hypothetical protein [Bacteroidota bacterium]